MSKPSRIPVVRGGFQCNSCKNPKRSQFGIRVLEGSTRGVSLGAYKLHSSGKDSPHLKCNVCGEMPPLKSNKGIAEEVERLSCYLAEDMVFCPNDKPNPKIGEVCSNHSNRVPVGTRKAYIKSGKNSVGSLHMPSSSM